MISPLIEQLAEYGLHGLIPTDPEEHRVEVKNAADYDEVGNYDYFRYYDEEDPKIDDEEIYDMDEDVFFESEDNPTPEFTVGDLQNLFEDFYYIDEEEFLKMNLWELIGITKKQMDLVPWGHLEDYTFVSFCENFRKDDRNISLNKKLLYAAVKSKSPYDSLILKCEGAPSKNEIVTYCERIVDRHSFDEAIDLLQLLADYYRFYESAIEMNKRREEIGDSVFKYEFFPKPTHLKDLHDKAFRDHLVIETERMSADGSNLDERIRTVSDTPDYKRYLFSDENFAVLPVKSQGDLIEEGKELNHCVASYGSYMASGKSYIFRIRDAKKLDKALYTVEVIPEEIRTHQKAQLKQCYGYNDTTVKTEKLRSFIVKWATKKNLRICCKI